MMHTALRLALILVALNGLILGQRDSIARADYERAQKEGIQTISYCELIHNPGSYDLKFVRVSGIYQLVGGEYSNLFDPKCFTDSTTDSSVSRQTETWAEFDELWRSLSEPEIVRDWGKTYPHQNRIAVVVVGKFYNQGGYGHLGIAKYKLVIVRIDNAKALPINRQF